MVGCKEQTSLRRKLQTCINPLDESQQKQDVVNIVTDQVYSYVYDAFEIGMKQMKSFEAKRQRGFHEPLQKTIETNGFIRIGDQNIYEKLSMQEQ